MCFLCEGTAPPSREARAGLSPFNVEQICLFQKHLPAKGLLQTPALGESAAQPPLPFPPPPPAELTTVVDFTCLCFPTSPLSVSPHLRVGLGAVETLSSLLGDLVFPARSFSLVPSKSPFLLVPPFQIPFNRKKSGEGFWEKLFKISFPGVNKWPVILM